MVGYSDKGPVRLGLSFDKRGAMFGLDARIALAIFGGLSIVTGAVLYYAIKQTKATTLIGEFESLAKGYTGMVLDIGRDAWINQMFTDPGWEGWRGPYSRLESATVHPLYPAGVMAIDQYSDALWNNGSPVAASNSNCWNWVRLGGVTFGILQDADVIADGTKDGDFGTLRYDDTTVGESTQLAAWYKISPCLDGPI